VLLVTVGVTTVAWVSATLLTRPESEATLVAFYKLVRPAGPGWVCALRCGFTNQVGGAAVAGKPAPHGDGVYLKACTVPVGASLRAMASARSTQS